MDVLIVLVEQANQVVSRRTLIDRVWPTRGANDVSSACTSRRYARRWRKTTPKGDISRTRTLKGAVADARDIEATLREAGVVDLVS